MTVDVMFKAPEPYPNGIQFTEEGLWVMDQKSDRATLLDAGSGRPIRSVETESSNTSGLTWGDGALWLAANGASVHREARPTDAPKGMGEILKVDSRTGRTLARYPLPGGGGVHGIEWDEGTLWLTTLKSKTLTRVDPADFRILHVIPVPLPRAHGLVREGEGIWCVHTSDRVIVKLDVRDGREMDRIALPAPYPEPHCLTARDGRLWYCDATSGEICRIIV